jgi:hypothetical protein
MRILITGSREWTDRDVIRRALVDALGTYTTIGLPVLIHGAAEGADTIAHQEWAALERSRRGWLARPETYRARDFPGPRARNQHMVDLGADVALAFADRWASGTGMCARMARRAGIPTIDYGVPTETP